jgi:endonuclease YncB( thermonuclease family)
MLAPLAPVLALLLAAWPAVADAGARRPAKPCDRLPAQHAGARRPRTIEPRAIHVQDGDTFYVAREAIRVRGIDTPELGQPNAAAARWRLIRLLRSGPVTIVPRVTDVYCRTVADVYVSGRDVAEVLRREGFEKPRTRPP